MTTAASIDERAPDLAVPDGDDPAALELIDARAGYGRIEVLGGVSLAVWPGEVVALLGPNGAGKSTTLGAMSGRLALTGGHRHVLGRHVNSAHSDELARIGISLVREGRSVYPNLSVADNLAVAASAGTTVSHMRERAYELFPRLSERRRQMAGTLSGGESQMLALACGLGADPAVLLIDELSMGLAPLIVNELYDVVAEVASSGTSVLLVEQFANLGLKFADRVYVMSHGSILYSGSPADAGDAIESAYMGGGR